MNFHAEHTQILVAPFTYHLQISPYFNYTENFTQLYHKVHATSTQKKNEKLKKISKIKRIFHILIKRKTIPH
jgi:hypothetical protein